MTSNDTPMRSLFPANVNTAGVNTNSNNNPAASTMRAGGMCAPSLTSAATGFASSSANVVGGGGATAAAAAAAVDFRLKQELASIKAERDRVARENAQLTDKVKALHARCANLEQEKAAANRAKKEGETHRDRTRFLETTVRELQEQLRSAEAAREDARKQMNEQTASAHTSIEQWQAHTARQQAEIEELRRQFEMAHREVASRNGRIAELEDTIRERNVAVDGCEGEIAALRQRLQQQGDALAAAEAERADAVAEAGAQMQRLTEREGDIFRLLEALAGEKAARGEAEDQGRHDAAAIEALRGELDAARRELEERAGAAASLQQQVQALSAAVEKGVREHSETSNKLRASGEQVAMLRQRLAHLESDLSARVEKEKEMLKAVTEQRSAVHSQADHVAALQTAKERALGELASAHARVAELEVHLRDRDRAIAEMRAAATEAKTREAELQSAGRVLASERDGLQEQMRRMDAVHAAHVQQLREEAIDRAHDVERLQRQVADLESTASSTRTDLTSKTETFTSRLDQLEAECRTKGRLVASLEESRDALERKNASLQQSLEETATCLGQCQEQLRAKTDECGSLHGQLGDIRADLQLEMGRHRRDAEMGQQRELSATATAAEAVQAMRAELQALRDVLSEKATALRRAEAAGGEERARAEQLARQLESLRDELQQLRLSHELGAAELGEARVRNDELLRRIEGVVEQCAHKDALLQDEQSRLLAQQQRLERRDHEAEELRAAVAQRGDDIAALRRRIGDLDAELEHARREIDAGAERAHALDQQRLAALGDAEAAAALERRLADSQAALLNAQAEIRRAQEHCHAVLKERAIHVEALEAQLRDAERSVRAHDALHAAQIAALGRELAEANQRVADVQAAQRSGAEASDRAFASLRASHDSYKAAFDRELSRHREYKKAYETVHAKLGLSEQYRQQERELMARLRAQAQEFMQHYLEASRTLKLQRAAMEQHNNNSAAAVHGNNGNGNQNQRQQQQQQRQSPSEHRYSDEDMAAAQRMEMACNRLSHCLMTVDEHHQQRRQMPNNGRVDMRDVREAPHDSGVPRDRDGN